METVPLWSEQKLKSSRRQGENETGNKNEGAENELNIQTGHGSQHDINAAGRDNCQSVRCDSQARGKGRRPNRSTDGKPPREVVECLIQIYLYIRL